MPVQSIGELLRETRGNRVLREFAPVIGCSTASLHKWESGEVIPSTPWLVRIAAVTGRSVQDIVALSLKAA